MIDELRQLYEATENDFNLKVQQALKKGVSKTELLAQLKKANKKSILLLEQSAPKASKVLEQTKQMNDVLIKTALREYTKSSAKVKRLAKTMPIKEAIYQQTQQGIANGLSIRKGGKTWSYKSYMEMNVRTTIQQEIGKQQLESGKNARVVFYICNEFGDCADDHKDWQGKIYYDDRYKSFDLKTDEIDKHIKSKHMKSMQWVMGKPVYLTTRPNCRHNFTPLSIPQVLNKEPKALLSDLKLKKGSYKPENYDALQTQRYNERMIRKYRDRVDMNKELGYDNAKDKVLMRQWQGKQRQLVKSNPTLERDYRRESNKVLLTDLGAKYNKKG